MSWSKIDDQFYDHPKIVAAGPLGIALFVCGLSYCSRHLTDGFISAVQIRRLIDIDDPKGVAETLVVVGLWEQVDGGYQVHDYLEYNPSRARVEATRRARIEAGCEGGLRSGEAKRKQAEGKATIDAKPLQSKKEANAKQKAKQKRTPVPVPVPVPNSPSSKIEASASTTLPKKKPSKLAPDTQQSHKMFDKLTVNAALKGRRGPQQFKTKECKDKFDTAAETLNGEFDKALKAALEQGITSVTGVTNYVARWASNLRPRHLKVKA